MSVAMSITVYGAGYVGLVSGICFASLGHQVLIIDRDANKIKQLKQGICPIHEPQLPDLLTQQLAQKRLRFSDDLQQAVDFSELQFIAVGTPANDDGSVDLSAVLDLAEAIAERLTHRLILINKSTSPPGSAAKIEKIMTDVLSKRGCDVDCAVVANPEFLRQGRAVSDFLQPDRVIVGLNLQQANAAAIQESMRALYLPLLREDLLLFMDQSSAELTKYAANAFLATRISFINEISRLSELFQADIQKIRAGMGLDKRIGLHFLKAGCGYGGSCFPKDVKGLMHSAYQRGYDSQLLNSVDQINNRQKLQLFKKLNRYFKNDLTNKVIAVWGLAFKPDTDDMREAPSHVLMQALWSTGAYVQAYDPVAMPVAAAHYPAQSHLQLMPSKEAALENADVLVIVTEWPEFVEADLAEVKRCLRYPAIFDGRNIYDIKKLHRLGLNYYAIGCGDIP